MKRLLLPEAYKREGQEKVLNTVFTDGEVIVTDDVAKLIEPALVNFYGVTVEDVAEVDADEADEEADPALTADQTKK